MVNWNRERVWRKRANDSWLCPACRAAANRPWRAVLRAPLNLPVIDKDDILESLFESKGTGDFAWRRALSRESDAIFQDLAKASEGALLVSFWRAPGMPQDSGTPTGWLPGLSGR